MVSDVHFWEGYACVQTGAIWKITVPSLQFCCTSKTAVEKFLKKESKTFSLVTLIPSVQK